MMRIALCQIECHPAIYTDSVAYPEEPFIPDTQGPSLSLLGTKQVDVDPLQRICLERYRDWSASRLQAILLAIGTLTPAPDILVFPEGGVSFDQLPLLREWAAKTKGVVFAGSHTPQRLPSAKRVYTSLGLSRAELKGLEKYAAKNVLPILGETQTLLVPKTLSSPFERSLVDTQRTTLPALKPIPLRLLGGETSVLPLICSDALQAHVVPHQHDLKIIISHEAQPNRFTPYVLNSVATRVPVAYCNDGRYGGTNVHCLHDKRQGDWFFETFPSGLASGDALLVVDLDLDVSAIEVGVADPRPQCRLVLLSDIVPEWSAANETSRQLQSARTLGSAAAREEALRRALKTPGASRMQQHRMEHLLWLESRGLECEDWWKAIGTDCVIEARDSLAKLEAQLAAQCASSLTRTLTTPAAARPDTAAAIIPFIAKCNSVAKGASADGGPLPRETVHAIVNRDAEISTIHRFFDDPNLVLLEVSGLQQIGKSSAIAKAISQSGLGSETTVALSSTASLEYLVASVVRGRTSVQSVVGADLIAVVRGELFLSVLRSLRVLVIEGAHHLLLERDVWRDELAPSLLSAIVSTAIRARAKLIVETRRELPISLDDPSVRARMRIYGLDRQKAEHGVALFDSQLRRVGLSPTAIKAQDKSSIVSKLGGHPVAIALAADACYEQGAEELLAALRNRRGFYLNFVSRLVANLALIDEEQSLLRLLCLARSPVPREVVLALLPESDRCA